MVGGMSTVLFLCVTCIIVITYISFDDCALWYCKAFTMFFTCNGAFKYCEYGVGNNVNSVLDFFRHLHWCSKSYK